MTKPKIRKMSWKEIMDLTLVLEQKILEVPTLRKKIKAGQIRLYGIPRGGLIPAIILSHRLGFPLVEKIYDTDDYLIIDDIYETGKTYNTLRFWYPEAHFAVLINKAKRKPAKIIAADSVIYKEGWLVMPWESKDRAMKDYQDYMELRGQNENK